MVLSDRRPKSDAPLGEARLEARRGTLPPPEWTSPRAGSNRPPTMAAEPLPRRTGTRAEEAWLRARVEEARVAGDGALLRTACATLARWLASRERDLDEAVELGTSALSFADDIELRREVSAWLESLGEAARAASVLRPVAATADVESVEVAYALVRSGVLKARAGAAAAAAAAFEAATSIDPEDALPAELLGALSAWQPDAVSPAAGAEAYVEAARRRLAQWQPDAEQEDLWRAFAADPTSEVASAALAQALTRSGRTDAADEVLRAHARALAAFDEAAALELHATRRCAALEAREPLRALSAALDPALDTVFDGEDGATFDAILLGAGLLDVLAARLEVRAERARAPAERAAHFTELGRLYAGPRSDPVRALSAYASALAADGACDPALSGIRALLSGPLPSGESGADEARLDPLRAVVVSIEDLHGETERYARLVETLARALPRPAPFARLAEEDAEILAAARAWVRASFARDTRAQAVAMERLGALLPAPLRAALMGAAANRHLALGDVAWARRTAEQAVAADPNGVRSIATLADSVVGQEDRFAAAALERAIAAVGPRLAWCVALANALDALGDAEQAVAWTQRCVAIRPGDIGSIETLLDRLLKSGDTGRLADALAWLLSQPQPLAEIAIPFGRALRELARVDPDRAAVVARRALDVFGPKLAPVREALLDAAARAGDEAFTAAVFERWLSCGAEGADRRHLFVRLAELYERVGDEDGEARIVARAIRERLGSAAIDVHLEALTGRPATPDAQLWRMSANANRLSGNDDARRDRDAAAWAWRELGGGLWDLADDRVGAIAAWERAARLAGAGGHATLALDLVAFGTPAFAFEYMGRLVDAEPDDRSAAAIAADAARAALASGEPGVALGLAARGIERCPSWSDALEVAEISAPRAGDLARLSVLYDRVGGRALGRFGRRAAHYRGARFFERRGEPVLALKHAAQAFAALPSEGSSFHMLARAAERAGDPAEAVRAVEKVADAVGRPEARSAWLLRAATIAGAGPEGARRRFDMLLRAILASPTVAAIARLKDATRALLEFEPEEREALEMRSARASRVVIERGRGPDGARVAIAFAGMMLDVFSDAETALSALEKAFVYDGDVDEYAALRAYGSALARARGAGERIDAILGSAETLQTNAGVAALRLLGEIAVHAGDSTLVARAAILAAAREPDDDELVAAADSAARSAPGTGEWSERLSSRVRPARRVEALVAVARARVASGANVEAARVFARALDLVEGDARTQLERELRAASQAGGVDLDAPERTRGSDDGSAETRANRWMDIAAKREARADHVGAVRALLEACRLDPDALERWSALERVAEIAGDDDSRILALERIGARVGPDGRIAVSKRLGRAHEGRNDLDAAERAWRDVLAIDPDDEEAEQRSESIVAARGHFAELADRLARRGQRLAADPARFERLRAVRLRRAAILEQRLGRVQDACAELEQLLVESPDNPGGLRYLADLLERQEEHARAAALWARAAAVTPDPDERDDLDVRAGQAARAAGDLGAVLAHAGRVLARRPANRPALELKRDAARATGADAELGDALEELAALVDGGAERSDILLDAALAAARSGALDRALARAWRAADVTPERATPQLLARGLEYRLRGAGSIEEARTTIEELGRITDPIGDDDVALRSFLLAEALDVVEGHAAGLREIDAARALAGDHPLLSLGLAERLAAKGQVVPAVVAYRIAVGGPLLGLRPPSSVAMAAADCAARAGLPEEAVHFLKVAERYDGARLAARARLALLEQGPTTMRPFSAVSAGDDTTIEDLDAAVHGARTPGERARARFALGRSRLEHGDDHGAEPLLREALAGGLVEAGDAVADLLRRAPDRARDLVRVRRQQAVLEPGDLGRLKALQASALDDGDMVYANAVEHVVRAFDPQAGPLLAPSLDLQPEQPGFFALLTRPSADNVGEALALLWEGTAPLFMRDPSRQTGPGIERVVSGPGSVISRTYEAVLRVLDAPRIPLFVSRSGSGAPSSQVALSQPPSVILSGDVRRESAEVLFELGRGMSGALPHNALCLGLPPPEGRALVEALRVAFAPPEIGRQVDQRAARLAEAFWQLVPSRTQRRIQMLLSTGLVPSYDELVERAMQSGQRVGMFLTGDFGRATRALVSESAGSSEPPSTENLRGLCERLPRLADLLRLAISPEYASARWHGSDSPSSSRRSSLSRLPPR